jgi:hypothetical protein
MVALAAVSCTAVALEAVARVALFGGLVFAFVWRPKGCDRGLSFSDPDIVNLFAFVFEC